ncbi:MAG TPA: response regulator [Candidatus Paceibacterota bacterium]|nr:response regulator [Candidatus Paceibacterota bacterium]
MPEPKKKIKILFVDDNDMMRIFFGDIFWLHGLEAEFSVATSATVEEAEPYLVSDDLRPDIVFFDMPLRESHNNANVAKMETGFEFLKRIKSDPKLAKVKTVLFTSNGDREILERIEEVGVDAIIVKSNSMSEDVMHTVEKFAPHAAATS